MPYLYDYLINDMIKNPFNTENKILNELLTKFDLLVDINTMGNYETVNNKQKFLFLFFDKGLEKIDNLIKNSNIEISLDNIDYLDYYAGANKSDYISPQYIYTIHMPDIFYYLIRKRFFNVQVNGRIKRVAKDTFQFITEGRYSFLDDKLITQYILSYINLDLKSFIFRRDLSDIHKKFSQLLEELKVKDVFSADYENFIQNINDKFKGIIAINREMTKKIFIDNIYTSNVVEVFVESDLKLSFNKNYKDIEPNLSPRYIPSKGTYKIDINYEETKEEDIIDIEIRGKCCALKFDNYGHLHKIGIKRTPYAFKKIEKIESEELSKLLPSNILNIHHNSFAHRAQDL